MMTRYIALLMRDKHNFLSLFFSVLFLGNVIRMNVDVVIIGSFVPENLALACR